METKLLEQVINLFSDMTYEAECAACGRYSLANNLLGQLRQMLDGQKKLKAMESDLCPKCGELLECDVWDIQDDFVFQDVCCPACGFEGRAWWREVWDGFTGEDENGNRVNIEESEVAQNEENL